MSPLLALLFLAAPPEIEASGVILVGPAGTPVAILRSAGRSRAVAVGEKAFDVTVVAVSPQAVTVEADGRRTEIRLTAATLATPKAAAAESRPSSLATPAQPAPGGESSAEPAVRTVDRRDIERRLATEIPRILAETVAVPVTEDGRVVGLALTRLADGTVLSETGLRPGDVLTKLNDQAVDGLPTLIGLWPRFQTESQIRAEVLRNGQPVTLTLNIR